MSERRRVINKLKLHEVSAVDRPAQTGATADIRKRDDLGAEIVRASELLLPASRTNATELSDIGRAIEKRDGDVRGLMTRLVDTARNRLEELIDTLVEATGASRDEATLAAEATPLGRSLIRIMDLSGEMLTVGDTASDLIVSTDLAKLDDLHSRLDQLPLSEDVVDAMAAVEAGISKARRGEAVGLAWLEKVAATADRVITGKETTKMTKKDNSPMDVLDRADRDAFGNVRDPAGTLDAMRKAAGPDGTADVLKAGSATAELDRLAKARASKDGVDFYSAYDAVCAENPDLLNEAVAE